MKLNKNDYITIYNMKKNNPEMTPAEISKFFGVAPITITAILKKMDSRMRRDKAMRG